MKINYHYIWQHYIELENYFIDIIKYVPLTKEHMNTCSFKFSTIIIDAGSSFIATLKDSTDFLNTIDKKSMNWDQKSLDILDRNNRGIADYNYFFEKNMNYSSKKIFLHKQNCESNPFGDWEDDEDLEWWSAYTDLKHDKHANIKKATLSNALFALEALFLANVLTWDCNYIRYLISENVIEANIPLNNFLYNSFYDINKNVYNDTIIAKTNLLYYIFGDNPVLDNPVKIYESYGF